MPMSRKVKKNICRVCEIRYTSFSVCSGSCLTLSVHLFLRLLFYDFFTQANVSHLLLVVGELGEACSEEYEQYVHGAERVTGSAQSRQRTTRHGREMDRAWYD